MSVPVVLRDGRVAELPAGGTLLDGSFPSGFVPSDYGVAAWTYNPDGASGSTALTAGVISFARLRLPVVATVTELVFQVSTAGATLTSNQCYVGLYNSNGTQLGVSASIHTTLQSTGMKNIAIGSRALQPGHYLAAILANGTTMPALQRSSVAATLLNFNIQRAVQSATGQTAMPTTVTVSGLTQSANAYWFALREPPPRPLNTTTPRLISFSRGVACSLSPRSQVCRALPDAALTICPSYQDATAACGDSSGTERCAGECMGSWHATRTHPTRAMCGTDVTMRKS